MEARFTKLVRQLALERARRRHDAAAIAPGSRGPPAGPRPLDGATSSHRAAPGTPSADQQQAEGHRDGERIAAATPSMPRPTTIAPSRTPQPANETGAIDTSMTAGTTTSAAPGSSGMPIPLAQTDRGDVEDLHRRCENTTTALATPAERARDADPQQACRATRGAVLLQRPASGAPRRSSAAVAARPSRAKAQNHPGRPVAGGEIRQHEERKRHHHEQHQQADDAIADDGAHQRPEPHAFASGQPARAASPAKPDGSTWLKKWPITVRRKTCPARSAHRRSG